MLSRDYDKAIIGLNFISLLYSLVHLKEDKEVLLIDRPELLFADKWYSNLSTLDIELLRKIGERYEIGPLINVDLYLYPKNTIIILDDTTVELSNSPYANIRELARKIPETFSEFYQEVLLNVDPEVFDQDFLYYIKTINAEVEDFFKKESFGEIFKLTHNKELNETLDFFLKFINKDGDINKQIHFLMQVMNQSIFSSTKLEFETKFLLLTTLAPRYEVNTKKLISDLTFEFRKFGGDYKKCHIKDWGVSDNSLKYLLLDSLDGVVKVKDTYLFGNIPDEFPFYSFHDKDRFLSINIQALIDHPFLENFKNKRIIFSNESRMGSDFPYWEISINEKGQLYGIYAFADYMGSKESFFYTHCIDDVYESLQKIFPDLSRADFVSSVTVTVGEDSWYNVGANKPRKPTPNNLSSYRVLNSKETSKQMKGIHLCSTLRAQSLGFYSYLLDLFSD